MHNHAHEARRGKRVPPRRSQVARVPEGPAAPGVEKDHCLKACVMEMHMTVHVFKDDVENELQCKSACLLSASTHALFLNKC